MRTHKQPLPDLLKNALLMSAYESTYTYYLLLSGQFFCLVCDSLKIAGAGIHNNFVNVFDLDR